MRKDKRNPNESMPARGGMGTPPSGGSGRRRGPMGGHGPMGGFGGMRPGDKPKDFKGTVKKLLRYLGSYKIAILIVMVFAVCSTVFAIVGPKILGNATTELFTGIMGKISGASDGVDFAKIAGILLRLVGLYLISLAFSYAQGLIMTGVSNRLTYRLRKQIDEKIHRLPFSYYDKTTVGDVLSRITNDVDAINQSFNQSITQIITSITTLVGIAIMMFSISWQMAAITILTLPLQFIAITTVAKRSQKHFYNQQNYLGRVNGYVEENYGCHTIVKAFNGEEKSSKEFNGENNRLYNSAWRANFLSGLMMPMIFIISNIGYVVVCVFGGYFAARGSIQVGDIQAFIQYMRQFGQPTSQLAQISNVLQQTIAAAERVFGFLEAEEETPDAADAVKLQKPGDDKETGLEIAGRVTFDHVRFGYLADQIVIKDFNAEVSPGQKIAIVGPTGAGKTTIVKLLMRFYEVNNGEILLDGRNIKDFTRDDLRAQFGMVLQDAWLYNGSIAENIRYGRMNATDEEMRSAARSAQVDHFVRSLPDGYNMILNEEASNVSQGQKQLLTIARAILADPKILILDEATSSVDTMTEILIQKAMDNLMRGRTSFIIAHRLSTIRNADLILVIDGGDIVEQGTHEELLARSGFYANLYNSQFADAV